MENFKIEKIEKNNKLDSVSEDAQEKKSFDEKDPKTPLLKIIEKYKGDFEEIVIPDFEEENISFDELVEGLYLDGKQIELSDSDLKTSWEYRSEDGMMRDSTLTERHLYLEYEDRFVFDRKISFEQFLQIFQELGGDFESKENDLTNLIIERSQRNIDRVKKEFSRFNFDKLLKNFDVIPYQQEYGDLSFLYKLKSFYKIFIDVDKNGLSDYQTEKIEFLFENRTYYDISSRLMELKESYLNWENFWQGSLPKILEMYENKELLLNFGGKVRTTGSNNEDYWVIREDGEFAVPETVYKRRGKDRHKIFPIVTSGQMALYWAKVDSGSEHNFKILFGKNPNEAQVQKMDEIQIELEELWEGRRGFSSGEESPSVGDGWFAELSDGEWEKVAHVFESDKEDVEETESGSIGEKEGDSVQEISFEEKLKLLKNKFKG